MTICDDASGRPGRDGFNRIVARDAKDWDDLAKADPYWAILTDPDRRRNQWDLDEFLLTGEEELASVLAIADDHSLPLAQGRALDVGCGVGRVTLAMSHRFRECHGVDISGSMVTIARQLANETPNCNYGLVASDGSLDFDTGVFDFVYCSRVLQHLPNQASIERMILELVRVLAPGGLLVFQVPKHIPLRNRIQPRRRAYRLLRGITVSGTTLIRRMGFTPMAMRALEPTDVHRVIRAAGATLVAQQTYEIRGTRIPQAVYFVTRDSPMRSSKSAS